MPAHFSKQSRRRFVNTLGILTAGTAIPGFVFARANESMTIQQVIDIIVKDIPGAPFAQTVDTIKAGDAARVVTGIVTTMFATVEVIEKTRKLGANFIIAHEPTFYNHADETRWLENDAVFHYKSALLKNNGITVWRCHDYIHARRPDGVTAGVFTALGWEHDIYPGNPNLVTIPGTSLGSIIELAKKKLHIRQVRYIGDLSQSCSRILCLPGAAGGRKQVTAIATEQPDLLIVGELEEWETSEYVRDLRTSGKNTALLVLGHAVSEEPGMEWLAEWLRPRIAGIKVTHVVTGDAFEWK